MRGFFKILFRTLLVLVVVLVGLAVLMLQRDPLVAEFSAPTSEEVIEARSFVSGVRRAVDPSQSDSSEFVTHEQQMNSVIKLGARIFPGFRGAVQTNPNSVSVQASLPLEIAGFRRWVNASGIVPVFEGQVSIEELYVGLVPLPGDLLLSFARWAANTVIRDGFGDTVLGSASAMRVNEDKVVFVMAMNEVGSNGVMQGLFGSLRGSDMPSEQEISAYYVAIRDAFEAGELPTEGSFLPVLDYTLSLALDGIEELGAENAFTAAVFGLSMICGARDFDLIVAEITENIDRYQKAWTTNCNQLTFNDRIDSRRHFITAAALQSASNRGFAISVEEFKELYDGARTGGFDFTDIAANYSGIRLSNKMMAAPAEQWPDLMARIQAENDVIVPYDGIPQIMSEEDFEARYGDVESPAYLAQLADIEARIDQLALHQ